MDGEENRERRVFGFGLKLVLLTVSCVLACAAPLIYAVLGLGAGIVGGGVLGAEFLVLGVLAAGAGAALLYKRRSLPDKGGKKDADRCGC